MLYGIDFMHIVKMEGTSVQNYIPNEPYFSIRNVYHYGCQVSSAAGLQ